MSIKRTPWTRRSSQQFYVKGFEEAPQLGPPYREALASRVYIFQSYIYIYKIFRSGGSDIIKLSNQSPSAFDGITILFRVTFLIRITFLFNSLRYFIKAWKQICSDIYDICLNYTYIQSYMCYIICIAPYKFIITILIETIFHNKRYGITNMYIFGELYIFRKK